MKFCNMEALTGLDQSKSDMTLGQIDYLIDQVRSKPVRFGTLSVTGGEPLLHPDIVEIVRRLDCLVAEKKVDYLFVNSNQLLEPPPELRGRILNFLPHKDKANSHHAMLVHPRDFGGTQVTHNQCTFVGKDQWMLNYQGLFRCCAGDYIRLFGRGDLMLDHIPESVDEFPNMDEVCLQCAFSNVGGKLPPARTHGTYVSEIYAREAEKNRHSQRIAKRWPELCSR